MKKFNLGVCVSTPAAQVLLNEFDKSIEDLIKRHASCDWGDVCEEDSIANDLAIDDGEQILSVYNLTADKSVYVITDGNRAVTTVLLPEDY